MDLEPASRVAPGSNSRSPLATTHPPPEEGKELREKILVVLREEFQMRRQQKQARKQAANA